MNGKRKAPAVHLLRLDRGKLKKKHATKIAKNFKIMEISKFTLFVGLNDKDSKQQEINTLDAYKIISNMITATFDGGTVSEAMGVYKHQDGTFTTEKTLRVEILFATASQVRAFVEDLKKILNQETIAVQKEIINSELW